MPSKEEIAARIKELCKSIAYEQQYIDRIESEPELKKGIASDSDEDVDAAYWIENDIWGNVAQGFINRLGTTYLVEGNWGKPIVKKQPTGYAGYDTTESIKGDIEIRVLEKLREEFPEKSLKEIIQTRAHEIAEELIDDFPLKEKIQELSEMPEIQAKNTRAAKFFGGEKKLAGCTEEFGHYNATRGELLQNGLQPIYMRIAVFLRTGKWNNEKSKPQQGKDRADDLFYETIHKLREGVETKLREEFPEIKPPSREL